MLRMKLTLGLVFSFIILFAGVIGVYGAESFPVNARAAALLDYNSGQFLLEYNADEKIEPASFTKVMTLY